MKRFLLILTALCLLMCACGTEEGSARDESKSAEKALSADSDEYKAVTAAVNGFNATARRCTVVRLQISHNDETLFFTEGTYSYNKEYPVAMSGKTTQIFGGDAETVGVFYKAGAYYRDSGEGKYYSSMERDAFLEEYLCIDPPLFKLGDSATVTVAETVAGTKYCFDGVDTAFCATVFDESFGLYCGLRSVAEEKTQYQNGKLSYTVGADGALKGFSISCQAILWDTPGYYPTGYTPTEAELTKTLDISYEFSVKATGDAVDISAPNTDEYTFLG